MQRTVRLPIQRPDDATWKLLRAVACKAARFGNLALADLYVAVVHGKQGDAFRAIQNAAYRRMNDELSGWVRGAMIQTRVRGYWRRAHKDVLAGRERLACFSADRSLVIAADQSNNLGALYDRDGESFVLSCRFEPVEIRDEDGKLAGRREPVRLVIDLNSPGARKDAFIREAVEAIWSGTWKPGTVTLRFDRMRHKLDALVSCAKPAVPFVEGAVGATLGPFIPETGELWLRYDDESRPLNFAGRINHMRSMKRDHDGIRARYGRRCFGSGRKRRQVYRRKLRNLGSFQTWSQGKMHQLSREIIAALQSQGVTTLRVLGLGVEDLPWHELGGQLKYKCEEAGIRCEMPSVKQDATYRAEKAELSKRTRRAKKAAADLEAARELLRAAT